MPIQDPTIDAIGSAISESILRGRPNANPGRIRDVWSGFSGMAIGRFAYATVLAAVSPLDCGAPAENAGIVHAADFRVVLPNTSEQESTPTRIDPTSPSQKTEGLFINPGALIEQSGLDRFGENCCIGQVDGGDWGLHGDIDFGAQCAFDKVILYYATPNAGGVVRFRLDNARGFVVGEVSLIATGSDFSSGGMVTMELAPIRGKHPLFVEFIGGFGIGNFTGYSFQASGNRKTCPKQYLPK
jgi:Carbohydrate binding module (family 6)